MEDNVYTHPRLLQGLEHALSSVVPPSRLTAPMFLFTMLMIVGIPVFLSYCWFSGDLPYHAKQIIFPLFGGLPFLFVSHLVVAADGQFTKAMRWTYNFIAIGTILGVVYAFIHMVWFAVLAYSFG